jgi:hypothetical protein
LENVSGYVSHRRRALAALLRRDLDAAFASWADAIRAHEQFGVGVARGYAGWRRVFPEFFEDERFLPMLKEFGLDPASTAKIVVPNLPF